MSSEITILTERVEKNRWLQASYNTKTKAADPVIIYIGNNNFAQYAFDLDHLEVRVDNLMDAEEKLVEIHKTISKSFSAVLIDLTASSAEIEKFHVFIKSNFSCRIICNKEKLNIRSVKFLLKFGLVDAAVDLKQITLNELMPATANFNTTRQESWLKRLNARSLQGGDQVRELSFSLKKLFDITIAAFIILILSPIFILIAIAIRLDSKGPIFYSSPRAGRGYRIFKFYKFRSMVVDADKKIQTLAHLNQYSLTQSGPSFFKLSNDPRVTRVGKFLRNTSLDELPQLFNVLKGDMSLVGNRPLPLYEAATLTTNEYAERFTAPAGMTGFWQIKKRGKAEMSIKERMDLDIAYARKASPLFDLYILANTPAALFQKSDV